MKVDRGIELGHGIGSRGQDPSGELLTHHPFRGSTFQHFRVRLFGTSDDKESGILVLKPPKS
jgi:hypothetical protein